MNNYMANDIVDEVAQHKYSNNKYYKTTNLSTQND